MTEKKEQATQTVEVAETADELRLLPFAVAGLVCFTVAVVLGTGSWVAFGARTRALLLPPPAATAPPAAETAPETAPETAARVEQPPPMPAPSETAPPAPAPTPTAETAPADFLPADALVEVPGGEIALGGTADRPLERVIVAGFSIAATEVTNAQYAAFIADTGHRAPPGWKAARFPAGTDDFPVSNVSFEDATAFCKWLATKIGRPVRLPTEAEWELAARGGAGLKYPWGNEWNKSAAITKETGKRISPVKSFAVNRSPAGAYDMAGNVWEWTTEKVTEPAGTTEKSVREALASGQPLRVVKGGSAHTPGEQISAQARFPIPENTKIQIVGFRYVVERPNTP